MDKRPIEDSNNTHIRKKAGMYISLFICIAALILGFWSAINRTATLTSHGTTAAKQTVQSVKAVEQRQTHIPATVQNETEIRRTTSAVSPVASFFTMPVGGEITKKYSAAELQYSNTYKDWRLHLGLDIAAESGTAIHSAGNGKVVEIYDDNLLGTVIEIDHGNDIIAYYCGVATPTVKKGAIVEVGDTIGGVGEVPFESVDKAHLHLEVKYKGEIADPLAVMKLERN